MRQTQKWKLPHSGRKRSSRSLTVRPSAKTSSWAKHYDDLLATFRTAYCNSSCLPAPRTLRSPYQEGVDYSSVWLATCSAPNYWACGFRISSEEANMCSVVDLMQ